MSAGKAIWAGHEFTVYGPAADWHAVGGLYIFSGRAKDPQENPQWRAYYFGETGDFSDRLPTHENWQEATRTYFPDFTLCLRQSHRRNRRTACLTIAV